MSSPVLDAAYFMARDYPGGAEALAQRIGKSPVTFRHELRPPEGGSAKLGVQTLLDAMHLSGDHRPFFAMGAELGYLTVPLPAVDDVAGATTIEAVSAVASEFGQYIAEVGRALADGRVSDNELDSVTRELGELTARAQRLQALLVALNAASKPADVVALRAAA